MKMYKRMIRPVMVDASWMGMRAEKTPLGDWMNEEEWSENQRKKYDDIRLSKDKMTFLETEEKYEEVKKDECKYCDIDSSDCCIFIDPLDGEWYLEIKSAFVDGEIDDWREYGIKFCPYCGKELKDYE